MASDAAGRFNDLAYAEAGAIAQVEDQACTACGFAFQSAESEQVRVGQVGDVNVVADAGAIGRGIVIAIDANGFAPSESGAIRVRAPRRG
jgi:hypothetical protein